MSSWNKVASSVLVQYVGRVAGLLVSLASTILLTRALGVAGYGEYTTAMAAAGLVIIFSDLGFFWSTIQSLDKSEEPQTVTREISGIRLVVTVGLIIAALAIVWLTSYPTPVKEAFSILAIFILSSGLNNVLIAVHQKEYSMGWPTIAEVSGRLTNLGLIALGVYLQQTLLWFVVAVGISSAINLLINWVVLSRRHGLLLPKVTGFSWAKYYQSVVALGIVTLLNALYLKVDVLILSALKSSTDVGIYGAAQKVIEIAMVFQALFLAAIFPLFLERLQEGVDRFRRAIADSFSVVFAIGFPIALVTLALSTDLIRFIAGDDFVQASTVFFHSHPVATPLVLAVLTGYVLLAHIDGVFTVGLIAVKRLKWLLAINGIAVGLNLILNLIFIPHFSYAASAAITVITEVFIAVANITKFSTTYRPPIALTIVLRVIVSAVIALIGIKLTVFGVAGSVIAYLVTYGLMVIILIPELRHSLTKSLSRSEITS